MCVKGFIRGAIAGVAATAFLYLVMCCRRKKAAFSGRLGCSDCSERFATGGACSVCDFRRLWVEHVFWTREVALLLFLGAPQRMLNHSAERLLQNQADIGTWFARALGDPALAARVSGPLTTHAELVIAAASAMHAGRPTDAARARLYSNGSDVANMFSSVSQQFKLGWDARALMRMMREHLDLTLLELGQMQAGITPRMAITNSLSEVNANEKAADAAAIASVRTFDRAELHIVQMADALAAGLKSAGCKM